MEEQTDLKNKADEKAKVYASEIQSENAPEESQTPSESPECCCCGRMLSWFSGNPEALGWALDATGRTVAVVGLGAFLAPALMHLAKEEAGCDTSDDAPSCDKKVYGIKPSSIFTTILTIVGVCSAPLLPLVGAVVDYTPRRRTIGRIVSFLFCAILFPLIFVNETTWFPLTIFFIAAFFVFMFQMVLAYSYLPELTDNERELNEFTKNFTVITFATVVLYLIVVVGVAGGTGVQEDEVATAQIGQSISCGICFVLLCVSWATLFKPRPPARMLPEGESMWSIGFKELYNTIQKIWRSYRSLLWFFAAITFCDAAIHSLTTILITFLTDELEFESMHIGIAMTVMILFSIPGGWMAATMTKRFNPIISSEAALVLFIVNTSVAAGVLTGPEVQEITYVFVAVWGFVTAWKWTSDRMLVSVIIPTSGENTELMGLYLFCGMALTWVPPLVFTSLNEAGISQRIGLATLDIFFLFGILCYVCMGPYRAAVDAAQVPRTSSTNTGCC